LGGADEWFSNVEEPKSDRGENDSVPVLLKDKTDTSTMKNRLCEMKFKLKEKKTPGPRIFPERGLTDTDESVQGPLIARGEKQRETQPKVRSRRRAILGRAA